MASNVKRRRKELGLSQEALADLAGISRNSIAYIETRSENPSLNVMARIARALGMSVPELLTSSKGQSLKSAEQIAILVDNLNEDDTEYVMKAITDLVRHLRKKE
ncbi:MAG: helix-turn-helix transcriptional regulator [Armatimonadota bacterium]